MRIRRRIIYHGENNEYETPRIVRLVDSLSDVNAQMLDRCDRLVIRHGNVDRELIRTVSETINGLTDGEDKYRVAVEKTKKGAFYFDCRRVA